MTIGFRLVLSSIAQCLYNLIEQLGIVPKSEIFTIQTVTTLLADQELSIDLKDDSQKNKMDLLLIRSVNRPCNVVRLF